MNSQPIDLRKVMAEMRSEPNNVLGTTVRRLNNPESKLIINIFQNPRNEWSIGLFYRDAIFQLAKVPLIDGLKIQKVMENELVGVEIQLSSAEDEHIYVGFMQYLVNSLANFSKKVECELQLYRELKSWKIFFGGKSRLLSKPSILGLAGELLALDMCLVHSGLKVGAVADSWLGPERGLHDFQFDKFHIEIKSSGQSTRKYFSVSGEEQLDDLESKDLYVAHNIFEWSQNGLSLPSIIEQIRQKINPENHAMNRFEDLLHNAGYHDMFREYYEDPDKRFLRQSVEFYTVKDGFPRIRPNQHDRIQVNQYTVFCSLCEEFLIGDTDEFLRMINWN